MEVAMEYNFCIYMGSMGELPESMSGILNYPNKECFLMFKYLHLSGGWARYTYVWELLPYEWSLFLFWANTMSLLKTSSLIFFFPLWVTWHRSGQGYLYRVDTEWDTHRKPKLVVGQLTLVVGAVFNSWIQTSSSVSSGTVIWHTRARAQHIYTHMYTHVHVHACTQLPCL